MARCLGEARALDLPSDVLDFLGGLYAEVSPHGAEHWESVWQRLDEEHHRAPALTTEDLAAIERMIIESDDPMR